MTGKVAITCFCIAVGITVTSHADVKDELQGIKKEIQEKKLLLNKTKKVESQVTSELGKIERNLHDKEANLAALTRQLNEVDAQLGRTEREIETVKAEADRKKQQIKVRLAAVYKGGELGTARMFFSSESFPQMAENLRYMKSILANDRRLVADYNAKIGRLSTLRDDLEREAARKEKLKGSIEVKKREIEAEKQKKATYLAEVRVEKKSYQASLQELEANSRRLQAMVEKLDAKNRKSYTKHNKNVIGSGPALPPVADTGFASQKGRLAMPAKGQMIGSFGRHKHPEFNSYTVSNGISIAASTGSDIRSVYEGQVIFADYFKGYGNMVIVDHGGGYFSLYAHAARLLKKVGTLVTRNEVVASVGDSDSSRGSMLYFEIRYQGKPVDPAAWVR